MKKIFDKKILVWLISIALLIIDLVYVFFNLTKLNVLIYLLLVGILPAIILFLTSFLYGYTSNNKKIIKYIVSITIAILFSIILLIFCNNFIGGDAVEQIINNSVSSESTQISMRTATVGDNIQSFLLYVAFSGIGCFFGNIVNKKSVQRFSALDHNDKSKEYD